MIKLANPQRRRRKDQLLNALTYLSSAVSILVLAGVAVYIFSKGFRLLSIDLICADYWSKSAVVAPRTEAEPSYFPRPQELDEKIIWSEKWGIGLYDSVSHEKQSLLIVGAVSPDSVFAQTIDTSAGVNQYQSYPVIEGLQIQKINFLDQTKTADFCGMLASQTAAEAIAALDKASVIRSVFIKTNGGGIRGSLIATLEVIFFSLLFALPIGIASAVYLHEIAKKGRFSQLLRAGIETLTGVPSIIYGLMGVTVLFPITAAFGAVTTNLLLGSLTLAVILLPTIIRSTEEALMVVPQSLRDASLSLGASETETIFKVILPCSFGGILTGILLSIGRIIGESAALIYTMGTFISDSPTLLGQATTLAVHIWSIMSGEQPNFELACAISILILIFVLILNILVKLAGKRLSRSWS